MTRRAVVATLETVRQLRERRVAEASELLMAARAQREIAADAVRRREQRIEQAAETFAALSRQIVLGEVMPSVMGCVLTLSTAVAAGRDVDIEALQAEISAQREAEEQYSVAERVLRSARGRLEAVTQWRQRLVLAERSAVERRDERDASAGRPTP